MCQFASFVLTKTKVRWLPDSDRHEDIIDHYKLNDGPRVTIVRVELTPGEDRADLVSYKYVVDQDKLPNWYVKEVDEARTRETLAHKVAADKAYDEAIAPARKAYYEAIASADKAYDEAIASADKAYDEAIAGLTEK